MTRARIGGSFGVRKVATRAEQRDRKADFKVALTRGLGIVDEGSRCKEDGYQIVCN